MKILILFYPYTSKYKGVNWNKKQKKWIAKIRNEQGCKEHLGCFLTEIDAAVAYNHAAKVIHGEFARLNIL